MVWCVACRHAATLGKHEYLWWAHAWALFIDNWDVDRHGRPPTSNAWAALRTRLGDSVLCLHYSAHRDGSSHLSTLHGSIIAHPMGLASGGLGGVATMHASHAPVTVSGSSYVSSLPLRGPCMPSAGLWVPLERWQAVTVVRSCLRAGGCTLCGRVDVLLDGVLPLATTMRSSKSP